MSTPPGDPGHDPGHPVSLSGTTWGALLARYVEAHGGWVALAEALQGRLRGTPGLSTDVETVKKGLRRLAGRGTQSGGKYGRWVLRAFGLPPDVRRWLASLGQYHSRFADLPTRMRLEQLHLWERPPITDSAHAVWLDLGVASALLRLRDTAGCDERLAQAWRRMARAGPAAECEARLLRAWRLWNQRRPDEATESLAPLPGLLDDPAMDDADRLAYLARLESQRAQFIARSGERADLEAALETVARIPAGTGLPFVDFRRAEGLARYHQLLGRAERARELARAAMEHAADGGFVRFRVLAMRVLARASSEEEAAQIRARARRLAALLDDEDLEVRSGW